MSHNRQQNFAAKPLFLLVKSLGTDMFQYNTPDNTSLLNVAAIVRYYKQSSFRPSSNALGLLSKRKNIEALFSRVTELRALVGQPH